MNVVGAQVLVIGIGATGAAVSRVLVAAGARVSAIDSSADPAVQQRASELARLGVTTRVGVSDPAEVPAADIVVPSPGVPEHSPLLAPIPADRICSEPELAWRLSEGRTRLLAVTGTNGKTTTTEMLGECVGAPVAGNIGTPLIEVLTRDEPPPLVVAELSSFQLRFVTTLRPDVAVLVNLAPDHLDWHGSLDAYGAAKARLWSAQTARDALVMNRDDEGTRAVLAAHAPPGRVVPFTTGPPDEGEVGVREGWIASRLDGAATDVIAVDDLAAQGPHNTANAVAAAAAALVAGTDAEQISTNLRAYRPGRHRLETVAVIDGVSYVDDSKATNPHAAAAALASFAPRGDGDATVVWIAGGLAKGLSFDSLTDEIHRSVRAAFTIGTSAADLAAVVRSCGRPAEESGTLAAAVEAARAFARPGDTVLLAPACASMDQFRDYADRGDTFRRLVTTAPESREVTHGAA